MLRLPKQIYLLIAAAVVLGFLLRQIDRKTSEAGESIIEAELIQGIPAIPNLAGWPRKFLEELKSVHAGFQEVEGRMEALASLGELYLANGFYGEAQQCFSTLVILDPENPRWPYFLGITTRDYRDKRIAIDAFERAIRLDDAYLNIRYELGSVYVASGYILDSVDHFKALSQVDVWRPWAHFGLARGFSAEGRYNEASEHLIEAVKLEPEARSIHALLSEVALNQGDRETALESQRERDNLGFDKTPYDPWVQSLADRCYDPIRLIKLARAEVFGENIDAAGEILARLDQFSGEEAQDMAEVKALRELIEGDTD